MLAGVDEAGRGPLFGPVTVAACILPEDFPVCMLGDSKKLSEKTREQLFPLICEKAVAYAIEHISSKVIDQKNILQATLWGMKQAVSKLSTRPSEVWVDGNQIPVFAVSAKAVVKGDSFVPCIQAASILAKVARDRVLQEFDEKYPGYGLKQHKGYPTKKHIKALYALGPTPDHRYSYAPVAKAAVLFSSRKMIKQDMG